MKHLFSILLVALVFSGALRADEWKNLGSETPVPAGIQLLQDNADGITIEFNLQGFWLKPVAMPTGERSYTATVGGATPMLEAGAPDLGKLTASVHIPNLAHMEVVVIEAVYQDFESISIAPSKGNLYRNVNPEEVAFVYGETYQHNAFYPSSLVWMREPYIIREKRGQTLVVNPFQYNPLSRTLRVYSKIVVGVKETQGEAVNVLDIKPAVQPAGSEFEYVYSKQFLNYSPQPERYTPLNDRGNMLIISYGPFMEALQPFVDWKVQSGMEVEMVDVATIGNSAAIRQYVADYYTTNGLTFLLLAGDAAQVPPGFQSGDSDNIYSYIVGNDSYPDLFVGRFSADNLSDLQTQIDRTLDYEMNPYTATNWYDKTIGIASQEGPGDNNELDFEHIRVIQQEHLGFTYTYAHELFEGSQGGNDAPGHPTPAQVAAAVNQGATVINYTGHGSQSSWGSSGFSISNVNQLTNTGMLPFIWSVACVNGDFKNGTCFAEAWLRATHNNEPSGAIAMMASTINQSWNPPMSGQDEMNLILTEAYENNIRRTFGGLSMNGCMKMNDAYGSGGDEMTDTWVLFGDPSLMVRTANPGALTVTHNPTIFIGVGQFTLTCSEEGAFAALTFDDQLLGAAEVQNGVAVINFDPIQIPGTATLTVTAFNHLPYIADLDVIPNEGPFVVCSGLDMNDENGNGQADYSENILLSLNMFNVGMDDATQVNVVISSQSEYITINDASEFYGTIPAGETITVADGFSITIAQNVPDNTIIALNVSAEDGQNRTLWNSAVTFTAYAPVIGLGEIVVDDATGNNNGKLDPGETVTMHIGMANTGGSAAYNASSVLTSASPWITVETESVSTELMASGSNHTLSFVVSADELTPEGDITLFTVNLDADHDFTAEAGFTLIVGQVPVLVLDLADGESGTMMNLCIEELNVGMDMMTSMPENLALYRSVFVNLGIYPENTVLSAELGQKLADYLIQGGNLYMEGGDTWAYDEQTAVHSYFGINGLEDGSGDLGQINGVDGSFAAGLSYTYDGLNSYIDKIAPSSPTAFSILRNQSPVYVTAVANVTPTYKTVGASMMFAGLTSEVETEQTAFMASILNFFQIPYVWTGIEKRPIENSSISAYPNPFRDQLSFSLEITESSRIQVVLYDLSGRQVASVYEEQMNPGTHELRIPDAEVQKLQSGVYFGRVFVNDNLSTTKLIKW
jgi:hypothetical protein